MSLRSDTRTSTSCTLPSRLAGSKPINLRKDGESTTPSGARRNSASTALKIAVVPPIASARVTITALANAGAFRSVRQASRTSRQRSSTLDSQPTRRTRSLVASTPPISIRAARMASARVAPVDSFCSIDI
jgi:hypothetical protein